MNIEDLEDALKEPKSAISEKVNNNFLELQGEPSREQFYDSLLDLNDVHFLHGTIDEDTFQKRRAELFFERDETYIYNDLR